MSNSEKAKKISEAFFKNVTSRPMHRELASQPYSPLITLMTVDYLLTARDLPGWPGRFKPIDYRKVLIKGINELRHGLYGDERICREFGILNNIADKHGLGEFFRERVRRTNRFRKKDPFEGYGINETAFFLDADDYRIYDIFDAAYAAKDIYQVYSDFKASFFFKMVSKSIKYRFNSLGKGRAFPGESDWNSNNRSDHEGIR
jgi:hypothetical protein